MRLQWSEVALADLDNIEAWIERENPAAARRLEQRIRHVVEYLVDHPYMGRPGRVPETRELVVSGTPYVVAYKVGPSDVIVLAVVHHARRWPDVL